MGLRFRKSFKIAPGVKLNLNKNTSSVTLGGKGFHYTVNSKGKRTKTVGIPGTGISYSTTTGGTKKSSSSAPPTDIQNAYTEPDNSNKPKKGCLSYLLYFFIFCIALSIYSYVWIPGIIATIYFAIKKSEPNIKKKRILISTVITITSLVVSVWLNSSPDLTSINADWSKDSFDINDTVEVKITPTPSDADIEDLVLSSNNIADLEFKDGKAIITFKQEGSASLFFTANDSIISNTENITVIDKEAEQKRIEEAKKAEEEKIKAEQEAAAKAEEEAKIKAEQEAQAKAEEEANQPQETEQEVQETMVWIPSSGKKYHSTSSCSNMSNPSQVTEQEAINRGFTPCKRCY